MQRGGTNARTQQTPPITEHSPYGCSLEGISRSAGKAAWYRSTVGRIRSAIWGQLWHITNQLATHVLVNEEDGNVLAVLSVLLERGLDGGRLRLCASAPAGMAGEGPGCSGPRMAFITRILATRPREPQPRTWAVRTRVHDHKVLVLLLVDIANAREEEASDRVLLLATPPTPTLHSPRRR
jgi:hypothetical protein